MGDHMLRREFLFSENNPCDWTLQIIKLTDTDVKIKIYIYISLSICIYIVLYVQRGGDASAIVNSNLSRRVIDSARARARGVEAPDVAVKLLSRCKMSRGSVRNVPAGRRESTDNTSTSPLKLDPMIYDEQFGDDGGYAAPWQPRSIADIRSAQQLMARLSIDPSAAIDIVIVC